MTPQDKIKATIVLQTVSKLCGVDSRHVLSPMRKATISKARKITAFLVSKKTSASTSEVARFLQVDPSGAKYMLKACIESKTHDRQLFKSILAAWKAVDDNLEPKTA